MTVEPGQVIDTLHLRLVVPGRSPVPVSADARYAASDPYAVRLAFHTGTAEVVEWTFARQLLTDGVTGRTGEGDVTVCPAHSGGRPVVRLALSSPSGQAAFELPLADLVQFLTRTYAAVPTGAESRFVDVDGELDLLLRGDDAAL